MQLVRLGVALSENLDHIVEVSRFIGLELHAHLDAKACGDAADVLVLAVEARVGRLREHDPAHVLGDVADGHSHLIVLVWLNVCNR